MELHYPAMRTDHSKNTGTTTTTSREKAVQISHEFLARRLGELARGDRAPKTSVGRDLKK